ncbi:uncharacterized protein LOC124886594 [Capsicum annuum]|uniref:uncharacterized protein LOC124886594 n=1 Tax=Capsicum annuum TaxID=4072 RepID=UPI001FB0B21D|nr:uncharacterized protein LOC124886594 [Capsicum annuum]
MARYIYMLESVYPDSHIKMHKVEDNKFRPIVVIDGAHLGGAYKGTFVSASTLDGEVGKIDQKVKSYLEVAGFKKWAQVYSPINRERMMTSNIAGCINGKLKQARELPIIEFLEEAKKLFGKWNWKNRDRASYANTTMGSRFEGILHLNTSRSSSLKVSASSTYVYSVYDKG